MTTINTIEDLARILRDQPTWAEALRALLLTQELLDLPGRFDRFVEAQREFNQAQQEANEAQREFNQAQQETNRLTDQRLNSIEGRLDRVEGQLGNLQGGQYERSVRTKALARSMIALGFEVPYVALNQDGLTDPQLTSAIAPGHPGRTCQPGRLRRPLRSRPHNLGRGQPARGLRGLPHGGPGRHRPGENPGRHTRGHHRRGRHPGRHHVQAEPGPIGPGGSGGSDHLRHTVSVRQGQTLSYLPRPPSDSIGG